MEILYLSGIIVASFLALVLLTKHGRTHADLILAGWMCSAAMPLFSFYLIYTEQHFQYPVWMAIGLPFPLAQGPFLYLYTKYQTSEQPFQRRDLLHFLPVLLVFLSVGEFFFWTHEAQVEVMHNDGKDFALRFQARLIATYLSGLIYTPLALVRLLRYRRVLKQAFSNTERVNFNWLLYLILGLGMIWVVVLFIQDDRLIYGSTALFLLLLGYFGIRQAKVFSHTSTHLRMDAPLAAAEAIFDHVELPEATAAANSAAKYQKSPLSEADLARIHAELLRVLAEQSPYKDPDLTLRDLAKLLGVHPNHLSQVINACEGKNFYDLINERRIAEFLRQVENPANKHFTLLAIAYECGFNAKASFNRNFKKYTGKTPSEYVSGRA